MQNLVHYLLSILLLSGCSSVYQDVGINEGSLSPAILIHEHPIQSGIVVEKIDGRSRGIGVFKRYELTPGDHSLLLGLNKDFYWGEKLIVRFQAKAGGIYRVEGILDKKAMYWTAWVVEDSSGRKFEANRAKP